MNKKAMIAVILNEMVLEENIEIEELEATVEGLEVELYEANKRIIELHNIIFQMQNPTPYYEQIKKWPFDSTPINPTPYEVWTSSTVYPDKIKIYY